MRMYPEHDLFKLYKERFITTCFSNSLPDVTKRITLEHMNYAINLADKWDVCMDIGGYTGHYLAPLAAKFKRAILVEAEPLSEQTQYAERYKNFSVIRSYIEKYSSPEKIDFILLADVYEHIPDIKAFVTQLSNMQTIGGVVYIMTPNPVYCGPAPESGLYHTRKKDGHIKQYAEEEIVLLMKEAGYTLVLSIFEEAPFRQKAKRVVFALSRRDKSWQKHWWYIFARPIFLSLALLVNGILDYLTYRSEQAHRHNPYVTMTQDLVFKKINGT